MLDLAPQLVFDPSHPMAEDYGSIMELQGGSMECETVKENHTHTFGRHRHKDWDGSRGDLLYLQCQAETAGGYQVELGQSHCSYVHIH